MHDPGLVGEIRTALEEKLSDRYALSRLDETRLQKTSLQKLLAEDLRTTCILPSKLRFAEHFDLDCDLLIYDRRLGTLGIVKIFAPPRREKETPLPKEAEPSQDDLQRALLRRSIDSATYVRHLLTSDQKRGDSYPLTVELVIVVNYDADQGANRSVNQREDQSEDQEPDQDDDPIAVYGRALREIAAETSYLHHIGVNFLRYQKDKPERFDEQELRRAFCWLLRSTENWFDSQGKKSGQAGAEKVSGQVHSIKLENYRLPGTRQMVLDKDASVHIVHGHNGSGKSSIVEALEYVTTGEIDRISQELPGEIRGSQTERQKRYADIIRNRDTPPDQSLRVTLTDIEDKEIASFPGADESVPFLSPGLYSTSFRLNQKVMDRLTEQGPYERLAEFLRAFFPEDREINERVLSTKTATERARQNLTDLTTVIHTARSALERLQDWQVKDDLVVGEDFASLLNTWLELRALSDLASKADQIVRALSEAGQEGWKLDEKVAVNVLSRFVLSPTDARALGEQQQAWIDQRDAVEQQIKTLFRETATKEEKKSGAGTDVTPHHPQLTHAEESALDAAGEWLFSTPQTSFGQRIRRAVDSNYTERIDEEVTIGEPGWTTLLRRRLDSMLAACESLASPEEEPHWPTDNMPGAFKEALIRHQEWRAASEAASDSFLRRYALLGLNDPINELMALFTPTRWAYRDIALKIGRDKTDQEKLDLVLDIPGGDEKVAANLQLNTAELNLFTVALFLLCARRVPNPLQLLLLDDPLQNMDEMTVTTLARGLAKLVRLWEPKDAEDNKWRLLMLFHGESDHDRVRQEVPSAVYFLQYQSPSRKTENRCIRKDRDSSNTSSEVQDIGGLVQLAPRSL